MSTPAQSSPPSTARSNKKQQSNKPTTKFVKSSVTDRLYGSPQKSKNDSPSPDRDNTNQQEQKGETGEEQKRVSPSLPAAASNNGRFSPVMAQREYLTELRLRQTSQLTSVASYLESHAREPFGALCGKNLGGWTYGPSYSRTVESLDPEAESYPPTASARRTVVLSSARTLPYSQETQIRQYLAHHHSPQSARLTSASSRPTTARSTATSSRPGTTATSSSITSTARSGLTTNNQPSSAQQQQVSQATSFYNVILEAPFNIHPKSVKLDVINVRSANGVQNQNQQQNTSARPLASEYYYPTRKRKLHDDELMSKADLAVKKHKEKQRKLEAQKERLKNAAPMEFRWQL